MDALWTRDASELTRWLREGKVSSEEVVEAHIERIEAVDGPLNAVPVRRFDQARAEARAADAARTRGEVLGALHGLPITVKEQFRLEGTEVTLGLKKRRGMVDEGAGPVVATLRGAGAVVLGKTNVIQTLMGWECVNPVYGRTVNPWDPQRTPGGSSGGEAAIIASGGSPLGLGGDFGGSVRIPSAFCGIAGLKPTALRLPLDDTPGELFSAQEAVVPQAGPMARSVADLSLAMSVMVGASHPMIPPVPWVDPASVDVNALRVGWFDDDGLMPASPAIRRAVREAAAHLEARGARVVPVKGPSGSDAISLFLQLVAADGFAHLKGVVRGEDVTDNIAANLQLGGMPRWLRPLVSGLVGFRGQARVASILHTDFPATPHAYFEVLRARRGFTEDLLAAMEADGVDLLLGPPFAVPAMTHGAGGDLLHAGAYAVVYNVLGFPAGVVPVTTVREGEESDRPASSDPVDQRAAEVERGSAGLPVGVQVAAPPWREGLILAAMAAIEAGAREADGYPATPREALAS